MSVIKISKLEAARRQISVSIDLLFNEVDIVTAHTLAGAAHSLLLDLVEHFQPNASIESLTSSQIDESLGEMLKRWRLSQNFFKHAKIDPDPLSEYEFNTLETDRLLHVAISNLKILADAGKAPSLNDKEKIFILWKFAIHPLSHESGYEGPILDETKSLFPDLYKKSRSEQLQAGKEYLAKFC